MWRAETCASALALEQVGNVIEDLDLVVQRIDERREISSGGGGKNLFVDLLGFFFRRHTDHLLVGAGFGRGGNSDDSQRLSRHESKLARRGCARQLLQR